MKIKVLEHGSADCPLIRIYGNEPDVFEQFRQAFEQLANGNVAEVLLTELPGVEPLGGCCLITQAGRRDEGIVRKGENVFFWVLTRDSWDDVALLIKPFCSDEAVGYQWLEGFQRATDVRVLVSLDGCW
ncbi:MAG TPA: hypothetical protein VG122_00110 [Gemmata sp.]|jgi:hypothetical protein|nr:hypothetical protein [Gemmata sp.]